MTLMIQTSKFPTRKIVAVIVSGMIVGGLQSLLQLYWPDHPLSPYMESLDVWLQGAIMVYAGYMTKERAYEPSDKVVFVEEPSGSSSTQLSLSPLWGDEEEGREGSSGTGASNKQGGGS